MKKPVAQFNVLFTVLKLAAAAVIAAVTATSALADTRINLSCTLNKFSPTGTYTVKNLRSYVSERIRIEISDSNQIAVFFASGTQFQGEVKRENSSKIAMEATRNTRDVIGSKFYMTYTLEWFKSNNKIFVDVEAQGYNPLGSAKGNCVVLSKSNAPSKPRTPDSAFGRAPDNRVCNMATENGTWQQRGSLQKWVVEARDRGLTLEDCEKVLKVN